MYSFDLRTCCIAFNDRKNSPDEALPHPGKFFAAAAGIRICFIVCIQVVPRMPAGRDNPSYSEHGAQWQENCQTAKSSVLLPSCPPAWEQQKMADISVGHTVCVGWPLLLTGIWNNYNVFPYSAFIHAQKKL